MISLQATPQSGQGLHAIRLRPLSSPGPWAPGPLIRHSVESHPPATASLGGLVTHRRASESSAGGQGRRSACVCMLVCVHVRVFGVGEGTCACVHTHALLPRVCQLSPHLCCCNTAWRAKDADPRRPPGRLSPSQAKPLTCLGLSFLLGKKKAVLIPASQRAFGQPEGLCWPLVAALRPVCPSVPCSLSCSC